MSLETDHIVDRRRLRRKLTFWRVAAVLIAIAGVAAPPAAVVPGLAAVVPGVAAAAAKVTHAPDPWPATG